MACTVSQAASYNRPAGSQRSSAASGFGPAIGQLLGAINRDRTAHHVRLLTLDARQSQCSMQHSWHMMREGAISHDQFPQDVCVPYRLTGENVGAAGGRPRYALLRLHHIMMSEGPCPRRGCPNGEFYQHDHYTNLVNPAFRRVGIGIVVSNGRTWLTEDFTN